MPKYTNKYNLPLPVVQALTADDYDQVGDASCTGLIGPMRIAALKKRHSEDIITEVSNNLWMMRGNAMHWISQKANIPGSIIEQRIIYELDGFKISMKADIIYPIKNKVYESIDYKDTKVFIAKHNIIKPEFKWQQNIYKVGYESQYGINIKSLRNVLFLGDWKYTDRYIKYAKQDKDAKYKYPDIPIKVIDIEILKKSEVIEYLRSRINLYKDCQHLKDDDLPECTMEERWASPDVFAVVNKNGRAINGGARFTNKAEAEAFQENRWAKAEEKKKGTIKRGDTHIEYRRSESVRCERGYCPVRRFCNQYKQLRKDPF